MPELTFENIEQIKHDITLQEISYSHLLDELVDHVCCDVENEMLNGLSFAEAYDKISINIGVNRFSQIQKDTLYAVDTKYRNMKNLMKISGIAGSTLLGLAALFKIQHWPGAGIMMTLGAFTLAFLFLPAAIGVLWKETHNKGRIFLLTATFLSGFFFIIATLFKIQHWSGSGYLLFFTFISFIFLLIPALLVYLIRDPAKRPLMPVYIVALAGMASYLAGLLFKIQHWPLASTLMLTGITLLCFIALPWYTWLTWRNETHVTPRFLFIIVGSLLIIVPGTLINLNMQKTYENEYYTNQDQQHALNTYLQSKNESVIAGSKDFAAYDEMQALNAKTKTLLALIDSMQTEMVRESGGDPVNKFLTENQSSDSDLEVSLADYREYLNQISPGIEVSSRTNLLAVKFTPSSYKTSMMSRLHSLDLLKNTILTVESRMLSDLVTDNSKLSLSK